jgi:hypothetical protein
VSPDHGAGLAPPGAPHRRAGLHPDDQDHVVQDESAPSEATPPWPVWEDDRGDTPPSTRRPAWLFVAAGLPWIVLAVVLVGRPGNEDAGSAADPTTRDEAEVAPDATSGESPADGAPPGATGTTGTILSSGARTAVGHGEAAALAVAITRAWLTGVGPRLALDGASPDPNTYVEHVAVEAIDHPAPGAAVVTVVAIVLSAPDDAYRDATVRRLAVPLRFDAAGAQAAGPPWPLPAPTLTSAPFEPVAAVTEPDQLLQAAEALTAAGFAVDELRSLERTASWPLLATAAARAPGADGTDTYIVWLREHLGRLVVAGIRPAPPTQETDP